VPINDRGRYRRSCRLDLLRRAARGDDVFGRREAPEDRREPGAGRSVSKVAQRYGVNANLLFTWRRQQPAGILLMQSQCWRATR